MAHIKRGKGARRAKEAGSTKNPPSPKPASASTPGLIDTALDHKLQKYLKAYEDKFPAGLTDAVAFCEEHDLFSRTDLTPEVQEMVARVKSLAAAKLGPKRKQKRPKGAPLRQAKGPPADVDRHWQRFKTVEEYIDEQKILGNRVSMPEACRALADTDKIKPHVSGNAIEKSYRKVESGDLHRGSYTPDYE